MGVGGFVVTGVGGFTVGVGGFVLTGVVGFTVGGFVVTGVVGLTVGGFVVTVVVDTLISTHPENQKGLKSHIQNIVYCPGARLAGINTSPSVIPLWSYGKQLTRGVNADRSGSTAYGAIDIETHVPTPCEPT